MCRTDTPSRRRRAGCAWASNGPAWVLGPILTAALVAALIPACACADDGGQPAGVVAPSTNAWTFAAIADNRRASERPAGTYEGVLKEIRDMKVNPAPKFPPVEFVVAPGDINTAADDHKNWNLWIETFKNAEKKPCYYPLIGNWDPDDVEFDRTVILPAQKGVVGKDPKEYYADWKNVRLIVSRDTAYVEKTIVSAPPGIQHVFIADHYPIFPRYAHPLTPSSRDIDFWKMLVKHKDRVRALLVGHTHHYSRMRVADPEAAAKDETSMPDEEGGIYQIDCGNAGRASHGDAACTIVEILVDGGDLRFRVVQAAHDKPAEFQVKEEWKFPAEKPSKQK